MKLLRKLHEKGSFFLSYLLVSFLFLLVASNVYTGAVQVVSAPTITPSLSSPESWVNITITPTPISANPGDTFTIDINIVNVTNLNTWDIKLKWKLGTLLECVDVQEGPFLKNGGTTFSTKSINNDIDQLAAGALLIGGTPQNGSGILANATFSVTDTGDSTLDLFDTLLADQNIVEIAHMESDGYFYTTSPKAEPLYVAPYYGSFYTPNPSQAGRPIVGETLTFNGSGCYDPDDPYDPTPGGIVSYKWDFGDSNITVILSPIITHVYSTDGIYRLNLTITDDEGETDWETEDIPVKLHDIAIINVTVSAIDVQTGDNTYINVTVLNEGSTEDSFNVTAYYIGIDIGVMNTTTEKGLISGQNVTLTLQWNTASVTLGTYSLFVRAHLVDPNYLNVSLTDLEEDKADNFMFGDNITVTGIPLHDIAITRVTVEPTQLEMDTTSKIKVEVKNEGNAAETNVNVNVTARDEAGGIVFQLQRQVDLSAGASQTLSFTWFTGTETAQEGDYNITAVVPPISGETDTGDNNYPVFTITMKMLPIANFTYSPSELFSSGVVTFDASSSYTPGIPALGEPDGAVEQYTWVFGDGNITTVSSPIITHVYEVAGEYSARVTITDNDDLTDSFARELVVLLHDIAVTDVTFSPDSAIAGELVSVNVTVKNLGDFPEQMVVRVYVSTTVIDSEIIPSLEPGADTTLQYDWDTASVADGAYNIMAFADTVSGEANIENNRRFGEVITIEKITLSMSAPPATITADAVVLINGSVETAQGPVEDADVTIWHMRSDGDWSIVATVTTDVDGQYSTEWTPPQPGSYAIKATWPGETSLVESDVNLIVVQETPAPNIFLYSTIGLGVAVILVAVIAFYFSRTKK